MPVVLKGNPEQITHVVFVGEQATLCRTGNEALLLLDPHSGQQISVSEKMTTAGALKINTLASHPNKNQSLYAVDWGSTLISLRYNGNHKRQELQYEFFSPELIYEKKIFIGIKILLFCL